MEQGARRRLHRLLMGGKYLRRWKTRPRPICALHAATVRSQPCRQSLHSDRDLRGGEGRRDDRVRKFKDVGANDLGRPRHSRKISNACRRCTIPRSSLARVARASGDTGDDNVGDEGAETRRETRESDDGEYRSCRPVQANAGIRSALAKLDEHNDRISALEWPAPARRTRSAGRAHHHQKRRRRRHHVDRPQRPCQGVRQTSRLASPLTGAHSH